MNGGIDKIVVWGISALSSVVLSLALSIACLVCAILGVLDMSETFWQVLVSVLLGMSILSVIIGARYINIAQSDS